MRERVQLKAMATGKPPTEANLKQVAGRVKALREDLDELNDYRDRWTDCDVALVCWLVAHRQEEREFWESVSLAEEP